MAMRFGFTKRGDFLVVDDERRIGEFAYVTSTYAGRAKKNARKTAETMLARTWTECPDSIRESLYAGCCAELEGAVNHG